MEELRLYKARIYELGTEDTDDRIRVRVMPYMADYSGDSLKSLPAYPPFQKGTIINGFSEKKDGRDKAESVWVAANKDFTVGYVIGKCNPFTGANPEGSYPFSRGIATYLEYVGGDLGITVPDYEDIVVQANPGPDKADQNSAKTGMLEFYNYKTGDKFIINESGACIIMTSDKIYLRVGSPSSSNAGSKFSCISIEPGIIKIQASVLDMSDCEHIMLGPGANYVTGTVTGANWAPCFIPVNSASTPGHSITF